MIKKNRRTGRQRLILKLLSCVIGFALWHILTQHQAITICKTVPLCFEMTNPQTTIKSPEEVTITLQGSRSDFCLFDTTILAAHINAQSLEQGQQTLPLTSSQLFLPRSLLLVHYEPCPLTVEINKEKNPIQEQQGVNS